jgi:hypothetical protein
MSRTDIEEVMSRREPAKPSKREGEPCGISRERHTIRDLWKEMWAGADQTNRRLRWRRWDRDLDFR